MIIKNLQKNKGFALLFAVTLAAILLSIALGITSVAFKELQFSTSAKDTNDAFFAADTGAECVMEYDKSVTANNVFTGSFLPSLMFCNGKQVSYFENSLSLWTIVVPGTTGTFTQNCAVVTVTKSGGLTTIVSKGHNRAIGSCAATTNTVERQLELTY